MCYEPNRTAFIAKCVIYFELLDKISRWYINLYQPHWDYNAQYILTMLRIYFNENWEYAVEFFSIVRRMQSLTWLDVGSV